MALLRFFPNLLNGLMTDDALFAVNECGTDSCDFSIAADTIANQGVEYFTFVTVGPGFNLRSDPVSLLVCYGYAFLTIPVICSPQVEANIPTE